MLAEGMSANPLPFPSTGRVRRFFRAPLSLETIAGASTPAVVFQMDEPLAVNAARPESAFSSARLSPSTMVPAWVTAEHLVQATRLWADMAVCNVSGAAGNLDVPITSAPVIDPIDHDTLTAARLDIAYCLETASWRLRVERITRLQLAGPHTIPPGKTGFVRLETLL